MSSDVQHIRLRRPEKKPDPPPPARHTGILQDQLRSLQLLGALALLGQRLRLSNMGDITRRALSYILQRPAFFAVRFFLSAFCVLAEASFYKVVADKINERVGRYLFFMLLFSAGMWNASAGL
ncbi:hypothetical protein C0993_009478 [Termitomyces sp. T159_Od127]|nr:hypothetical protein C0993_009478 [Termitomyces sp. T159_Od127]